MTPNELTDVEDAVRVESKHAVLAKQEGRGSRCRCGYCVDARDVIARHAPAMLAFIRDALAAHADDQ